MPIQGQLPAGAFLGQHRLQPEPRGEDRQVEVLHETPVPAPPPSQPHRPSALRGRGELARHPSCDRSCGRRRSLSGTPIDMSRNLGG